MKSYVIIQLTAENQITRKENRKRSHLFSTRFLRFLVSFFRGFGKFRQLFGRTLRIDGNAHTRKMFPLRIDRPAQTQEIIPQGGRVFRDPAEPVLDGGHAPTWSRRWEFSRVWDALIRWCARGTQGPCHRVWNGLSSFDSSEFTLMTQLSISEIGMTHHRTNSRFFPFLKSFCSRNGHRKPCKRPC